MPNALSKPAATTGRPEDDIGPLPEGWEERVHSDGRIFYIDHSEWGSGKKCRILVNELFPCSFQTLGRRNGRTHGC